MLKDNDLAKQFDLALNEKIDASATGLAKIEAFKVRLYDAYERELGKLHPHEQDRARKRMNLAAMVKGVTDAELHQLALDAGEQVQKNMGLNRKPKPHEIPRPLLGLMLGVKYGI